ncbi:restriction endonuclease subunit S [Enterobacter asburiae]
MSWPMVKLSNVCDINIGKTPSRGNNRYWGKGHKWLSIADMNQGKWISTTKEQITDLAVEESGIKKVPANTVLFSFKLSIGKVCLSENEIYTNEAIAALPIKDKSKLDTLFLSHVMKSLLFSNMTDNAVMGATLNKKKLAEILIPLPPIEEQKRIAAILDKTDGVRQKREQAIKIANDFLYSVFLEMFGDPVMNPKGFQTRLLSDFFIDEKNGTKCGPFGSALKKDEYTKIGVPVWNMDNITLKGDFIDSPSLWISEDKYEELNSYSVLDGDVIISRAGTVGKMGVVRTNSLKSIISTNLIRVRFGEKLYPEYFVSLMTYCKGRVGNLKTGPDGTFTHMNTGVLSDLIFPYPPLELQKKYIQIRQAVMLIINQYNNFDFRIDEAFRAINQKAFLCQS